MAKRRPKLDLESVHTISDGNGGTLQAKVVAKKQHSVSVGTRRGPKGPFRRILIMSWQDFWRLKDAADAYCAMNQDQKQPTELDGAVCGRLNALVSLPPVLDACCGSRAFWFDKQDERALYVDKRSGVFPRKHSDRPRAPVVVAPDWQGSFTELPYPDGAFDHVVFDPPHVLNSSASGNVAKCYGVLNGDWREELRNGFAECFRVLRKGGTLIFKWNEVTVSVREILQLTPERPLYGHKSGKLSKTHWIAFLKG